MPYQDIDLDFDVQDFIHHIELYLRSGYSLSQAIEIMARDLEGAAGREAKLVSRDLQDNIGLETALKNWFSRFPHHDLDLLIATIQVQREVGGNLADKLRLLGQIMAQRMGTKN